VADQHRDAQETAGDTPEPQAGAVSPASPAPLSARGIARRRFAKASAGATGVLLTLHSQPGMACTYCGISPSVAMSAVAQKKTVNQLSHRTQKTATCDGKFPKWWAEQTEWPRRCDPNAAFKNYFSCFGNSAAFAEVSARKVVAGAACDNGLDMGKFMLAAYLNVLSKRVDFIGMETLQAVWNEWSAKGYYAPMAGQKWYPSDIVGYLYGTMD
jgi:hypothetical protein